MKKFAIFAGVIMLGAGVAFASSLNVPFFLDRAPADGIFPPTTQEQSFIALHNNLSVDLEVEIDYYDAGQDGTVDQQTPTNNTFLLPANATFSFRPVRDDPTVEGVNAAGVPNMPGGETAGSAIITWVGGPNDIQGRMVQINANNDSAFAYLLPTGQ